jgi:hypothetical protein
MDTPTIQHEEEVYFYEAQGITQWWVWTFAIGILVLLLSGIVAAMFLMRNMGDAAPIILLAIILMLVLTPLLILLKTFKLYIAADKDGLFIKYRYLEQDFNQLPWKQIAGAVVEPAKAGRGFSLRNSSSLGNIYNVSAAEGVLVSLRNGTQYFIGSKKAEDLRKVIVAHMGEN